MGFTTPEKTNRIIANIILKKDGFDTPAFYKREKVGESRDLTDKLGTEVKGRFVRIEQRVYGEMKLVEITLEDDNGEYVVSGTWTSIMRNIVNTLAGTIKEFKLGELTLGLYEKAGNDGKLYPRVYIKNNGHPTARLLSIEEQQALRKEVMYKGKAMSDYTDLEELLVSHFDDINNAREESIIDFVEKTEKKEKKEDFEDVDLDLKF